MTWIQPHTLVAHAPAAGGILAWLRSPRPGSQSGPARLRRRRAERARLRGEERYRDLFENAGDAIATVDLQGTITEVNRAFERLLGRTREELIGTPLDLYVDAEARRTARTARERKLAGDADVTTYEQSFITSTGERVAVEVATRVIEVDGVPVGVQGVCRDITARRRAEVELHAALAANTRLALHDQLTGLPNRACFYERVAEALDPPGSAAGLLFLDLDRFKEINDTLGHHAGDAVLAELGARLRRAFRVEDTVARLGGDEFAVLLTGPDDMRRASEDAVERIAEALEQPFLVEGLSIAVEASIGIALHPEHGADTGTLLRRADAAMYAAKRAGVTHAFHDRTLERRDTQRLALVGELRRALERRELFLHYQPEADTADGGVAAVEALVRWRHPERGTLGPAEFIPFAEQTGMIRPLTRFVLDEALAQQRRWRRAGLDTRVAVNVAACSLLEDGFAEHVEHLLDRYDTPAGALIVEVTERAMIHDPDRARVALARLRRAGVVVALDDFGSGHSSLEQLGRLPLDQIKIGRAIAGSAATDRTSAAIVRAIVDLAHELGLEVVAEGIESGAAWDLVRALGADYVQGFHVSRPVAAARVPGLLQRAGDHGVAA